MGSVIRRSRVAGAVLVGAFMTVLGIAIPRAALATETVPGNNALVNTAASDGSAVGNVPIGISADGDKVLYVFRVSSSPAIDGIFERNMSSGVVTRVDTSESGAIANASIDAAVMSESGRYVAFISEATNLIDGASSGAGFYYVRDMKLGTITKLNLAKNETNITGDKDKIRSISNDGRYILIESKILGARLIAGVTRTGSYDVLRYDTLTNNAQLVNMPIGGVSALNSQYTTNSFDSKTAQMSCDGSFIVFYSSVNNLVSPSVGGVFLADMRGNEIKLHSLSAYGGFPSISCNGNYVTYVTGSKDEVSPTPAGLSYGRHIIEYDRLSDEKSYIDFNSTGQTHNSGSVNIGAQSNWQDTDPFRAVVSNDGDAIFSWGGHYSLKHISDGSNTLEGIQKTSTGTVIDLSYQSYVAGNDQNRQVYLSADGRFAAYYTPSAFDLGLITGATGVAEGVRSETGLQ